MNNQEYSTAWVYGIRSGAVLGFSFLLYVFIAFFGVSKSAEEVVTVYAYADMLSPEVFKDFEKETGIKVNIRYFEAVEELMTKLSLIKEEGIDVIAPSDSMVQTFVREKMVHPLDYRLLPAEKDLDPRLRRKFYDPTDTYSLPYSWGPVGIAYDSRVIKRKPSDVGWDLVFGRISNDKLIPPAEIYGKNMGRVCMGEDPWETLFIAAYHLFGSIKNLTAEKQAVIVSLLHRQKKWLECYTNNLRYFLISGISHAVVMPTAYVVEMQEEHDWVRFAVPEAGALTIIGCLCVPKCCKRLGLAHKVINYLLSKQGATNCFKEHYFYPANKKAYSALPDNVRSNPYLFPQGKVFGRIGLAHNEQSLASVEQMWYDIKR